MAPWLAFAVGCIAGGYYGWITRPQWAPMRLAEPMWQPRVLAETVPSLAAQGGSGGAETSYERFLQSAEFARMQRETQ